MKIGVLKEIKESENRVSVTPEGVETLVKVGHKVFVEHNAGRAVGYPNLDYFDAGAEIVFSSPKEIYKTCDMIMKVKEPLPQEYELIRQNQIIFTYLHLAADKLLIKALIEKQCIAVAYETIEENGILPALVPMSEIAGRMSIQQGAKYLEMEYGGSGVLLSGATGVQPGTVLILGGGTVGVEAARIANGIGAKVYVLESNIKKLDYLRKILSTGCIVLQSTKQNIERLLKISDLVIGAVYIVGAKAPKLITRQMLKLMKKGSVIVDVSIDQGGCFETSRPTTHRNPTFIEEGIVHYCVANMPGAVAKTSTLALTNATLPYALKIANGDIDLLNFSGTNIMNGKIIHTGVKEAYDRDS